MEQTEVGIVTPSEIGGDKTWSERTRRTKRTSLTHRPRSTISIWFSTNRSFLCEPDWNVHV